MKGTTMKNTTITRLTVAAAAVALALAGCSAQPATEATTTAADTFSISDAWVKAADEGMSAGFGEASNSGDTDITIVSATSTASSMLELHETVENDSGEMIMRPKDGGFVIPAGGALSLEPGANHIMLMDLVEPLKAGTEVTFTLTFSDGSTVDFTAPVKDYSGANETYEGDMDMED